MVEQIYYYTRFYIFFFYLVGFQKRIVDLKVENNFRSPTYLVVFLYDLNF